MNRFITHPSIVVSIGAGMTLISCSLVRPMPWQMWAIWGALSGLAVTQAAADIADEDAEVAAVGQPPV